MTRKQVKLAFTVRYDGSLLAPRPREFAPVLMTWSSAQRSAQMPRRKHYFPIVWQNSDLTDSGDMKAHVEFYCDAFDDEKAVAEIADDMTIGVRVKAHQLNERGDISLQNCGDTLLPLGQLLREAYSEHGDRTVAWGSVADKAMPLKLRFPIFENKNGERVVKGVVVVSALRAVVDTDKDVTLAVPVDADGKLLPLDEFAYVPHNETLFAAMVQDVMVRNIMLFTDEAAQSNIEFGATAAEAQRIHAPFFQTPAGLLPGFAYMLKPGAAAPSADDADGGAQFELVRDWLMSNLSYALMRANRSHEWFAETITRQLAEKDNKYDDAGMAECCEILGQLLVIAPTSMPYFSDTVSTNARGKPVHVKEIRGRIAFERSADGSGVHAVERFSEMADNDGGDCEDGGTFAYRIAMTLAAGNWSDGTKAFQSLCAAAALARQYVPMVNLGSVRAAAVGNDLTDDSKLARDADIIDSLIDRQRSYGAHMWGQMQPLVRFVAMVRRTVPDLKAELLYLRGASTAPWTAALPTLVLEATGRLSALQLPAAAYVLHDDEKNTRRSATVARAEQRKQLISSILHSTRTLRRMTMVRGQEETRNVPNKRINHFYRTTTHSTTAAFLPNGLSTLDFVNVQCGGRVPAPSAKTEAEKLFGNNPLSAALGLPWWLGGRSDEEDSDAQGERKKKNRGAARGASDSEGDRDDASETEFEEESSDDDDEDTADDEGPSLLTDQSPTRSFDRALLLAGAPFPRKRHSKSGDSLLAHSDNDESVGRLQYGVPMYDNLQTPLLAATGLAPSTPLSGREVRVIAELLRHSPPISTPGDWRDIKDMHSARLESLKRNMGVDVRAREAVQDKNFENLRQAVRSAMGTLQADGTAPREWPSRASSKWHLVTFIFEQSELEKKAAVDAITADVQSLAQRKVVRYARIFLENPMPHRRFVSLQFLCDSSKA